MLGIAIMSHTTAWWIVGMVVAGLVAIASIWNRTEPLERGRQSVGALLAIIVVLLTVLAFATVSLISA